MTPFKRGEPPPLLVEMAGETTHAFVTARATANVEFRWPTRSGVKLLHVVRDALAALTNEHCSYCDWAPIDVTGRKEVDHFKPKSRAPELVCEWGNLYLSCSACNDAKGDEWNEELLRPDEDGFLFERYFRLNPLTGALEPNPLSSPADRARALESIRIFGLQRPGLCVARRDAVMAARPPFRFLAALTK